MSADRYQQTIVMVTHDPVAASYTDRVVFLADGKVVDELGDPTAEAVLEKMRPPSTHATAAPTPDG
jgi:putative ABC transport system ATP-binding protein